jgi:hypothetical protein
VQPVRKAPIVPSWVLFVPRKVDVWAHIAPRREQEAARRRQTLASAWTAIGNTWELTVRFTSDFHRF